MFLNVQIIKFHFKLLWLNQVQSGLRWHLCGSNLYGCVARVGGGGWGRLNEQLRAGAATVTISPVAALLRGSLGSFPSRSAPLQ